MTDNKNRELAELLGLCWHEPASSKGLDITSACKCGSYNCDSSKNPDFTSDESKVMLLRLMMERGEDWFKFVKSMNIGIVRRDQCGHRFVLLHTNYITDKTGKLRDACLEWLRR